MAKSGREIRAGRAVVELATNDTELQKGLRKAQARLNAFGNAVSNVGTKLFAIGSAASGAFLASATAFASAGDSLNKMAARTGLSVEALSALQYAADQSGTSVESLERSIKRMQATIGDAARGSGTAVDALEELGLSTDELLKLSPEDQFKTIAEQISQINDPTLRAAAAMKTFGRSGAELLPLMQNGAAGIEALMKRAGDLGLTMTTEQAASAAALTDAWGTLRDSIKAATLQIGAAVAPVMQEIADKITEVVQAGLRWVRENQKTIMSVAQIALKVTAAGAAIVIFGKAISGVAATLGLLYKGVGAITTITSAIKVMTVASVAAQASTIALTGGVAALVAALVAGLGLAAASFARARYESVSFGEAVRRNIRDVTGLLSPADRAAEATRKLTNARKEYQRLQSAMNEAKDDAARLRITESMMENLRDQIAARAELMTLEGRTGNVAIDRMRKQFAELNNQRVELRKLVKQQEAASQTGADAGGDAGVEVPGMPDIDDIVKKLEAGGDKFNRKVRGGMGEVVTALVNGASEAIRQFRADKIAKELAEGVNQTLAAQARFSFGASSLASLQSSPTEQKNEQHLNRIDQNIRKLVRLAENPMPGFITE